MQAGEKATILFDGANSGQAQLRRRLKQDRSRTEIERGQKAGPKSTHKATCRRNAKPYHAKNA